MVINLPPLRERKEDLPLLVEHFLKIYQLQENYPALPEPIMQALYNYNWPGNIRELQNELQRYLAEGCLECFSDQPVVQNVSILPDCLPPGLNFREAIEAYEQRLLLKALTQHNWHQGKTAEMLGIPPRTLYEKIKKYDLKHEH
jgi:DNA-binding NtrC family response regulator